MMTGKERHSPQTQTERMESKRKKADREPFASLLSNRATPSTFPLTQGERHRQTQRETDRKSQRKRQLEGKDRRKKAKRQPFVSLLSSRATSSTFPADTRRKAQTDTERKSQRKRQTEGKDRRTKVNREPFVSLLSNIATSSTFPLTQRERHRKTQTDTDRKSQRKRQTYGTERRKKAEREPFVSLLSNRATSSTFPLTRRERYRQTQTERARERGRQREKKEERRQRDNLSYYHYCPIEPPPAHSR